MLEYMNNETRSSILSSKSIETLSNQIVPQLLWRKSFFQATGEMPSNNKFLMSLARWIHWEYAFSFNMTVENKVYSDGCTKQYS